MSDAERVAGALQARGIGPGDVVAVQLPGSYAGAVVQVAVGLCGAVLLPVVMIYGPREMDFVLRSSGASAVVLARSYRGRAQADAVLSGLSAAARAEVRRRRRGRCARPRAPGTGRSATPTLLRQPGGAYRLPRPDPGDRAVLMYTSGTTADPKGVQHSHRTLLAEATSRVYTLNGPGARHLGLFPPGHMAGLLSLLRILLLGTPTVIMEAWDAALAATLIDRHAVTSCGGAPVQLSGLLDQQALGSATLGYPARVPDRRGAGAAEPDRAGRGGRDHRVPLLRQQRAPDGDRPGASPTRWACGPAPTAGCWRATRSAWWTPTVATCPTATTARS